MVFLASYGPTPDRPARRGSSRQPTSSPRGRGRPPNHRRRRLAAAGLTALALVLLLAAVVSSLTSGDSEPQHRASSSATAHSHAGIPAVESGLLPWRLRTAISRELVMPASDSQLTVLGGLINASASTAAVGVLNTADGSVTSGGSLPAGVHDAAGASIHGRFYVFGGGSPATVPGVSSYAAGSASRVSQLPAPRSDATAASIGGVTYIVGGFDGTNPDASILATSDGRTFKTVGQLALAVRYPAVAALGNRLYVFGGEVISGPEKGAPTDAIQTVDPASGSSHVIGHLPEALEAAAAVTLGDHLYLAGGDTSAPQPPNHGLGSTQLPNLSGSSKLFTSRTIWAFDPGHGRVLPAGHLQVPVSHAGVAVLGPRAWLVGGEFRGTQLDTVQMIIPDRRFGTAGALGAGSPYFGSKLLVADRGNNRLLLLDPAMRVVWRFPSASSPPDRQGFYFPDDAFFIHHGTAIISNQEQHETIQEIAYPSGKVLWNYGHPGVISSAKGYLHEPDDAYVLPNGNVTVADAYNCRVLIIKPDGTLAGQIGNGACAHRPPASIGPINGDTPLRNGDLLVSEVVHSWVDEFTPQGRLVWSTTLPITYPSDPQQLGGNLYLIADYFTPGQIVEFNRAGNILYRYKVQSGPGELKNPSLVELLPSGVFMTNDDFRHRMVAFDPATQALVWQYGITDHAGTSGGMLNTPDGFDILLPDGSTPTHRATG